MQDEVDDETVMKDISSTLPYENPERILHTMIAWGRYAGLMDYDADTKMVTHPKSGKDDVADEVKE